MITLNSLTVDLLRIIGEANKLCSNLLTESFLKEDMKVDVKTFVSLLNSYSNTLEKTFTCVRIMEHYQTNQTNKEWKSWKTYFGSALSAR